MNKGLINEHPDMDLAPNRPVRRRPSKKKRIVAACVDIPVNTGTGTARHALRIPVFSVPSHILVLSENFLFSQLIKSPASGTLKERHLYLFLLYSIALNFWFYKNIF